jgi:hypothetical protein
MSLRANFAIIGPGKMGEFSTRLALRKGRVGGFPVDDKP